MSGAVVARSIACSNVSNGDEIPTTQSCFGGSACMAWSFPDHGFAEVHMTTEAPAIPW